MRRYLIDETHTNPYYDYVVEGRPDNRGMYNPKTGELECVADDVVEVGGDGGVRLSLTLPDLSVTLIEVTREGRAMPGPPPASTR